MKAIIISLNSTIDTHFYIKNFECNKENFVEKRVDFAGGKGINTAKVLNVLSVPYRLFVLLGKENSEYFSKLLEKENIQTTKFYCDGKTRENISIHAQNISETRLCENSFFATDTSCSSVFESAFNDTENGDIVIFSGRIPKGVSKENILNLLIEFKQKNVKLIIDSASFSLEDYYLLKPFLIKPNEDEIAHFGSTTDNSIENLLKSGVDNIAFSKGKNGIFLFNENEIKSAVPPKISALSTVGAGDSSIAGFVSGLINSNKMDYALRLAVTCGTANCLTEGGVPPLKIDIENIFDKVKVSSQTY